MMALTLFEFLLLVCLLTVLLFFVDFIFKLALSTWGNFGPSSSRFIAFLQLIIPERRESTFPESPAQVLEESCIDSFCIICSFMNQVHRPEGCKSSSQ